jgi:glycosyltransferase domain-containing protein
MHNHSEFKDITFLICLKNRAHATKRLVKYLNNFKKSLNLFFADGGDIDQSDIIKTLLTHHNYTYKKFEVDKDYFYFANKIKNSLDLIKTKYCCFMDNDDFINFDSVLDQLRFLDENPTFYVSTGKIINFNLINNSKIDDLNELYNQDELVDFSSNFKFLNFSSWEGIHVTEKLFQIFNQIVINKIDNIRNICDALNTSSQVNGKIKFNKKDIFILRQANTHFYDIEKDVSGSNIMIKNTKFVTIWKILNVFETIKVFRVLSYNRKDKLKLFYSFYSYYFRNILKLNMITDLKKIFFIKNQKIIEKKYTLQDENEKIFLDKCAQVSNFIHNV